MRRIFAAAALAVAFTVRTLAVTLEELAADPQLWPTEVVVQASVRSTLLKDGKPAGAILLGKGRRLQVTGISADGLTGRFGPTLVLVPAEKTNLFAEVARLHPELPTAAPEEPAAAGAAARAPAVPAASLNVMQRRLSGHLVRLEGEKLVPVDVGDLADVKYFGLYYSASWCGPCREFTPQFIQRYRLLKKKYPQFEVVFVSADHSAQDMRAYMKDDGMPWLALDYAEAQRDGEIRRYCGPGIPCLVLVDPTGQVLSDSFEGDNYVGPNKVLQDAARLLAKGG